MYVELLVIRPDSATYPVLASKVEPIERNFDDVPKLEESESMYLLRLVSELALTRLVAL